MSCLGHVYHVIDLQISSIDALYKLSRLFYDLVMLRDMQSLYAKYNPFAPLPFPDTPIGPPRRCAGVCSLVANHIGSIRRAQGKGKRTGMCFQLICSWQSGSVPIQ